MGFFVHPGTQSSFERAFVPAAVGTSATSPREEAGPDGVDMQRGQCGMGNWVLTNKSMLKPTAGQALLTRERLEGMVWTKVISLSGWHCPPVQRRSIASSADARSQIEALP